ncbi:hypothetical protein ACJMK2_017502 [Sinanodonta woodiana]|uniref:S1 motif domain-containing protein n=1 Tax=Sinanodonta woodiana TaxID=1069815 RepID=A0ABD3UBX4_SINWO
MDSNLLGLAVEYHGPDLLRQLTLEEQPFPETVIDHLHKCRPQSPEIKDEDLMNKVRNFIAKKSDILFKPVTDAVQFIYNPMEEEDNYGKMPPIETFMGMPSGACRKHFFNSLEKRDIVIGVVSSIMDSGLIVTLLCLDCGKSRDIDELKLTAFCPNKELPRLFPNQSAVEAFQVKDKVRGVVLSVNPETEKINISLLDRALPDDAPKPKLGLISEEEFPVQYRRKLHVRGLTFDELLHSIIGFNNGNSVPTLLGTLQQKEEISLMRGLHELKIPEKEFSENIRKIQSQKWAHQSVASGIKYFKAGKHMEAMQELNRALQIDTNNVEALVARGALYANNESYHKAIKDFEDALAVNLNHSNARKYLFETLLAVARETEERGTDLEEAEYYYKKALCIQPESQEARESLRYLHTKREKQGQDKRKKSYDSRTSSTPKSHDQREDYPLRKDKDHSGSTPPRRNSNASPSSSKKFQKNRERSSVARQSPEKFQEGLITSASQANIFLGKTTETLKKLIKEDKKGGKKRKRKSTENEDSSKKAKKKRHESHGSKSNDSSFEELYIKEEIEKQRERESGQKSSEDHSRRRKMMPDFPHKSTDLPAHDSGLSRRLTFFSTDMQQRGLRIPGLDESESDNDIDANESRPFPGGTQKRIDHSKYENREFEENDRYLELLSPQEGGTDARNIDSFDACSSSAVSKYRKYQNLDMSQEMSGSGKKAYSERNQSEIQSQIHNEGSDVDMYRRKRSKERYNDKEDDEKMLKKDSAVRKDSDFKGMSKPSDIRSSEYTRSCVMSGNVEEKNVSEASAKAFKGGLFVDIPRQLKKGLKKDAQNSAEKTTVEGLPKESHHAAVDKKFRDVEVMIHMPEQEAQKSSDQSKRSNQGHEKGDNFDKSYPYNKDIPLQKMGDRKSRSSDISQKKLSVDREMDENRTGKDKERSPTRRRDIKRNKLSGIPGSRSLRRSHSRSSGRSCRRSHSGSSGRSHSRSSGRSCRRSHSRSSGKSRRRSHSRSSGRSCRRSHSRSSGRSCRRSHSRSSGRSRYRSSGRSGRKSHSRSSGRLRRRSHSRSSRRSHNRSSGRSGRRSSGRSCRRSHSRSLGRSHNRFLHRSHSRSSGKSNKLHRSTHRSGSRASKRSHSRSFRRSHSKASQRSQSCSTYSRTSSRSSSRHSRNRHLSPSRSDRLMRRPYEKYSYRSRFRHREGRGRGPRISYSYERSSYRGRGRGRGREYRRRGYYERKDYSEWRRKMLLVNGFKAKMDLSRVEKEKCSIKIDKSSDFQRLEEKDHLKHKDDSNEFGKSLKRKSVDNDSYMMGMTRYTIDSGSMDDSCIRNNSQHESTDNRLPGSPVQGTSFGKDGIGGKCVSIDKLDKLASSDKNPAEVKTLDEVQCLKELQHIQNSGQYSPGRESIKSNHSSPFRKNVASPGIPLLTVDLKSKWDSPKRKSRWGTPDQYSVGIGLEMPLIFTKAWKGGPGSPVVESKLSVNENVTVDKEGKEIHIDGRKEESDTFKSLFKKMSPDNGKEDMDENISGTGGGNEDDIYMKRLHDIGVEDFRDGISRLPQTCSDLIDDHVPSSSSQKGKYQRENITISVTNTGHEIERIASYDTKDERSGLDERCQAKGKIEPIFHAKEDYKYDARRKMDEHYMNVRQRDNTGFYDNVSGPESRFTTSEIRGSYHRNVSSEHLNPTTTTRQIDLPDLTYSRAQSPGQHRSHTRTDSHVQGQEEMPKGHSKLSERTSSTRRSAKEFEKQSGARPFETYFKRSRSRSWSCGREGKIRKYAANEKNRKEGSKSKQLKLETSPRQKLKTRSEKRSSSSTSSSSSSSSASDSPSGKKHTFTDKRNTLISSKSNLSIGKSQAMEDKLQDQPGGRSIRGTSDESNKKRRESLDELESFLNQLKEKKKEQWIAEGKIKDKNSDVTT